MGRPFSIGVGLLLAVGAWAFGAAPARGQVFGDATVVDPSEGTSCVVSADLDGDGAVDLVAAAKSGNRVAWFPQFEPSLNDAVMVGAADLDGVWLVGMGTFAGAGATDPGLAGVSFYFQALTGQAVTVQSLVAAFDRVPKPRP